MEVALRIKEYYLNQIVTGVKTSEFRTFSDFYISRLFEKDKNRELVPKDIKTLRLYVGNTPDAPFCVCEVKGIFVNQYFDNIPEGYEKGDYEIEIELGKVLEHNYIFS